MSESNGELREAILGCDDLEMQKVETPEWAKAGVECVYVRTLSGFERDLFEEESLVQQGKTREVMLKNIRARLVILACVDVKGNRVFNKTDAAILGRKSAKVLDRIFSVAQEQSGLRAEDVEELVKKSGAVPSSDSG